MIETPGLPGLNVEEDLVLLQQVLALVPLSMVVTDAQRRIVYINETFTRETGYTVEKDLIVSLHSVKTGCQRSFGSHMAAVHPYRQRR